MSTQLDEEMENATDVIEKWHMDWLRMFHKKRQSRGSLVPSHYVGNARDLTFTLFTNLSGLARVIRGKDAGCSH